MSSLSRKISHWRSNIRNNYLIYSGKGCRILELPDYLLENICQCLLTSESVIENLRNITPFSSTCSRFYDIASRSKLNFRVVLHDNGNAVMINDVKGMYKDYVLYTCNVSINVLELLNSRFNWKCNQLRLYCREKVQRLLNEIEKYPSIFESVELIRFERISPENLADFVNAGLLSFFSPSVNFQLFSPEELEYTEVHPFVADRCYELAFRTSDEIEWALETRKFGQPALKSDSWLLERRINLTTKFKNLSILWLFCRLPVNRRVCLPTIKTLFVRDYHFHAKSSKRFGSFLSEAFPNVTYLDFFVGAEYAFITGEVILPSLISLNTDWYVLPSFKNCTNIRHLKQRNTEAVWMYAGGYKDFDRYTPMRHRGLVLELLSPSGSVQPFWQNLKVFVFEFYEGPNIQKMLDEVVNELKILLKHNQGIEVISGYENSSHHLGSIGQKTIRNVFKNGDCTWYLNHPSLKYFKVHYEILVMKSLDKDLRDWIYEVDYFGGASRYSWQVQRTLTYRDKHSDY